MPSGASTETGAELEAFVSSAKAEGVGRDQLERFLGNGYVPLPWQLRFHGAARACDEPGGPVDLGVGGARGPGKSHGVFAQVALDDCQRVPGLKGLFLRQTGKAASESFNDLILRVLPPETGYRYNGSTNTLHFPNGSRVLLGGFENERDIDKYIGIEYDLMGIEERNQITEEKVVKLRGSLRTSKPNWRPRMYSSFNPGGIGHGDIKARFIEPFRAGTETQTRFVPSTYRDNPYLNAEYVEYLEGLTGDLGRAWRDGDWDLFAGQFFSEWRAERHVVAPFAVPEGWKRYRAYDHGFANPACCKWYAVDYDGQVWVYRELYRSGATVEQLAAEIVRLSAGESYDYSVADPAIFARTGFVDAQGGQTIAESFARNGVTFAPASNRRVDGWNLMREHLAWSASRAPRMRYFSTCADSIRTIPTLIHDERKPEDLDTRGEDHAADADRYFLLTLHERRTPRPRSEVERKLDAIRERQRDALLDLYS
jgi:phage terminase large subunit